MNEQQENISPMLDMTAGEMLKNARTTGRRKREISTIAKLLCIKEEFLTALEEGNYRVIPEDVYILGFARSYAVELGIDPDEVILKLKKELGIIKEDDDEDEEDLSDSVKSENSKKDTLIGWLKISKSYVKKHWIWFASGLGALICVLVIMFLLFGGKTETNANDTALTQENTETIVIKEPDFRYPVHERFETKNRKESRVVLQAEKEAWIKIDDARGKNIFSRVLIPGDVYYMPASDKLNATFGNAGAVDVWVDGQLIKKLGPLNTKKSGIKMAPDALKAIGGAD